MPIEVINFEGANYPAFQANGGASIWCRAFAQELCCGEGLDIGYSKEKWMLPGAIGIEPSIDPTYHAMHLPVKKGGWDYIHSSHSLEHVKESWTNVLDYWISMLKHRGVLFLYLPHISQKYWNIDSNRKHIHQFDGSEIKQYLSLKTNMKNIFVSGVDLNNSFIVIAEKYV
jgi:hypothetical protein